MFGKAIVTDFARRGGTKPTSNCIDDIEKGAETCSSREKP